MGRAIVVGAVYVAVGVTFAALAGWAASDQIRTAWRLTAFGVSGVVFVWNIWLEHRRGNSPVAAALHASLAVALGGFGLAAKAGLHSLTIGASIPRSLLWSLLLWPLLTGLPAFVVALVASAGLARGQPRTGTDA